MSPHPPGPLPLALRRARGFEALCLLARWLLLILSRTRNHGKSIQRFAQHSGGLVAFFGFDVTHVCFVIPLIGRGDDLLNSLLPIVARLNLPRG